MNTLAILLLQTKSDATFEIIIMLLGSAIIGYLTAWLYTKAVYEKKIKIIEYEKHELNNRIVNLDDEIFKLKKSLIEKNEETEHLILEVKALKALHAEAVQETDDMTSKNKRNEQLLYEKDEALVNIAQRKHLLDYKSFGSASESEKDDLKMISGIGPFIEERLHALDIYTFSQISKLTHADIITITEVLEIIPGRIEEDKWVEQARELVKNDIQKPQMVL